MAEYIDLIFYDYLLGRREREEREREEREREREKERERERGEGREGGRERGRESVCVCAKVNDHGVLFLSGMLHCNDNFSIFIL